MRYPFTITIKHNLLMMFNALEALGYHFVCPLNVFLQAYKDTDLIYVVIDNAGIFGNACFYSEITQLDPNILRTFIVDNQEFLRECANLKGETEF